MRALTDTALKEKAPDLDPAWLETVRLGASGYAKKLAAAAEQGKSASPREEETEQVRCRLTRREMEVLVNLSQGMTQKEIAGISSLSVNTVKGVIRNVCAKLGAVNKADAIRIAASQGLV
jgi:DNA-binding NarL/FixJ family response regulator